MRQVIIVLRYCVRVVGRSERGAAADDAMNVHVREHGHLCVARIHATHVATQWHLFTAWIVGVNEIVISMGIFAERGIILCWGERQWRAAAPAPDELRRQQFALLAGLSVFSEETVERSDARLVFSQADVGAVAAQR